MVVFVVFVVFIVFVISIIFSSNRTNNRLEQYPEILYEDEISVVITKIKKIKGVSFVNYNNGAFLIPVSANFIYKCEYFDENVFMGDSLYKRAYSDTIYVFSKTRGELYFVHGEYINED